MFRLLTAGGVSELRVFRVTPLPAWHLDMAQKAAAIARKAGFTYDQLYDTAPSPTFLVHDIYKIEDGLLPAFKQQAA